MKKYFVYKDEHIEMGSKNHQKAQNELLEILSETVKNDKCEDSQDCPYHYNFNVKEVIKAD